MQYITGTERQKCVNCVHWVEPSYDSLHCGWCSCQQHVVGLRIACTDYSHEGTPREDDEVCRACKGSGWITFRADPYRGAFYEVDDPKAGGTVGRLIIPMNRDGSPSYADLNEIAVSYEDI